MPTIQDPPPQSVANEIAQLNLALDASIPRKKPSNILIATWNIREFNSLTRDWFPSGRYSPKRDLRALLAICNILRRFDVIAIQEVGGDLRSLRSTLKFLGTDWAFLMTDITRGDSGGGERLAYLFNTKRVKPSGLAGEVVVPSDWLNGANEPIIAMQRQFARTPYAVSFRAGSRTFILLTVHINYGDNAVDRVPELRAISQWMAKWAEESTKFHHDLIVLGDFNIDRRGSPLWEAFTESGLHVPEELNESPRSIFSKPGSDPTLDKYYDQIAWFQTGKAELSMELVSAGSFDFVPHLFSELTKQSLSFRLSDHYPLWAEFKR